MCANRRCGTPRGGARRLAARGDCGIAARALEPALDAGVAGALLVPGETVVDPWLVPIAYARHAYEHGATIRRSTEVRAAVFAGGSWRLTLASGLAGGKAHSDGTAHSVHEELREPRAAVGQEESRVVVACGGLHGDRLEGLHRAPPFGIRPRRQGPYGYLEPTFGVPSFEDSRRLVLNGLVPRYLEPLMVETRDKYMALMLLANLHRAQQAAYALP